MIINTADGSLYYSIAYTASILLVAVITYFAGISRGYHRSTWSLIIFTALIFFILGEKFASYSSYQWSRVFTGLDFPVTLKKTILGGFIGQVAGLMLAKTWLRFNQPVLDHYAVALPLGMAVARMGCLSAGCCFGTPTALPWGIHYTSPSLAFTAHQIKGLIGTNDHCTAAIHPVQFYELTGCLVIAWVVWRTRNHWKAGGNLFLFSLLCYAPLRFLVEFVRDPFSGLLLSENFLGLKRVQWVMLLFMAIGVVILFYREKRSRAPTVAPSSVKVRPLREFLLIACVSAFVIGGRNWFSRVELNAILIFLIPVSAFILAKDAQAIYRYYLSKSYNR
jgi:phosphatidylglycerol:prolipoprotein diacylglycerol transferase